MYAEHCCEGLASLFQIKDLYSNPKFGTRRLKGMTEPNFKKKDLMRLNIY